MAATGAVFAGVGGEATGLTATGVTCRNLTTGQSVSSSSQATDWDCASLGLIVNVGDRVRTGIRGVLPVEASALGFGLQLLPEDFVSHSIVDDNVDGGDIAARDLDGDGDLDVAFEDPFLWLENLGGPDPSFDKHFLDGPEGSAIAMRVMDVDFDGKLDIVASFGGNSNKLMWFENDGGSPPDFVGRPIDSHPGSDIFQFAGTDVDGDGDTDFFASMLGGQNKRIVWIEDIGTSYVKHLIKQETATGLSMLVAMDADSDDDPDLIVADLDEDTVSWYENDGGSFVVEHPIDLFQPLGLLTADLDGDGDLDVIARPSVLTDGELRWYETVGDGSFLIHSLGFFAEHDNDRIAIGDFSADGRTDIVFGGVLSWLENEGGSPPSFTEHSVSGTVFTQFIAHGDIDLDGRLDIVGIGRSTEDIWAWHENQIGLRFSVSGLTVRDFTCHNRSTGQRFRVPTSETSIDCENEGLTVNPGDEIEVTTRGQAN